ncbi:hypothetical protein VE01_00371 [Pseudogymnoascus verrucosus]|uniref:Cytochrome P450 n=1 Tax=Pseudogymnoascus verrucosus TaxID=342668 RepID=A0A2P2SYC4_9PEZI|nr:uncharacterized protein VE01_00371 [Pseudogymnoascus verrucosus]OBU01841.1 hypothetical protein VE01_00371 [Pseudogymnoascus verrucosus]
MTVLSDLAGASPSALVALAISLSLYTCYSVFISYWRLRDVPGPFWAKFTDFQRMFWVKTMRAQEIHREAHEKYGDCVRFGPNTVSLCDPAMIPILYPMRSGFPKSLFYRGIMPYAKGGAFPAVFTTQDEQMHKTLKTPVASLYSLTNVINFEPFIDEVLEVMFNQLDARFVETFAVFDLGDWIQYFAFDVMGTMTFSKRYGFLENGNDANGLLRAIWDFMLTIGPMTQFPKLDRILYKSFIADILKNQVAVPILRIASEAVEARQKDAQKFSVDEKKTPGKGDFLSHFIRIQETNNSIPAWASKTWTFSNVIAGSDSTTVVMRTAVYHLLANKDSLAKLVREFCEVDAKSGLTRPFPKWNEVKNLPYLDACVNEAVRLHPPFALPLERVAPRGGVTISGHHFPEGTCIGMNPYVVNRHRPTFGEDVDAWRPERWLVDDPALRKKLEGSVMTFGAGRRTCIGRYIAFLEIKKLLPALFLNYDIELIDPKSYFVESSYFFRQEGIDVRIQRKVF